MLATGTPATNFLFPGRSLAVRAWERGAARAVAARVLDQVLDVVADLPDVVPHRELDVAVPLHRAPEQVLALGGAVDPAGGLDPGERGLVPPDECPGEGGLWETP